MHFERLLHELRLMKDQPRDRYYAALILVLLVKLRFPLLSILVALYARSGFHLLGI